jgi:hypothetical protein
LKRILLTLLVALGIAAGPASAQAPAQVVLNGHMAGITGVVSAGTYVGIRLMNCSGGAPRVTGYLGLVPQSANIIPDSTGYFTTPIWSNDVITCGTVTGLTRYQVTYVLNNVPQGVAQCYDILTTTNPFSTDTATSVACNGGTPPPTYDGTFQNLTVLGYLSANHGGSASLNVLNSATFNADDYTGSDVCAKIQSAQLAMLTLPGTIEVNTAGTCATALTLLSGHKLKVNAPVTFTASVTLAGSNTVTCPGWDVTLTMPATTGQIPFIIPDASNFNKISGCHFVGSNTNQTAIYAPGNTSHTTVDHNYFDGITPVQIQGASTSNVEDRFEDNTVICTPNPQGCGYAVVMYGRDIRPIFSHNYIEGALGGAEYYSWSGNDPYPARATLVAYGSTGGVIDGNVCKNTSQQNAGACVFLDGVYGYVVSNNTSENNGDVAFDTEISAMNSFYNNWATGCGNGCYSTFFASYANEFKSNHCYSSNGSACFLIKNNSNTNGGNRGDLQSVDTLIQGNTTECFPGAVCTAIFLEPMHNTRIIGNTIINGVIASNERTTAMVVEGNIFNFTVSLNGNSGLSLNQEIFGYTSIAKNNIITTEVAQTGACMVAANSDFSGGDRFVFEGNDCRGAWGGQVALVDTTTPATTFALIRNNHFASLTPTYTATGSWTVTTNLNYTDTTIQ